MRLLIKCELTFLHLKYEPFHPTINSLITTHILKGTDQDLPKRIGQYGGPHQFQLNIDDVRKKNPSIS